MGRKNDRIFSLSKKKLPWLVVLFLLGVVLLAAGSLLQEEKQKDASVIAPEKAAETAGVADMAAEAISSDLPAVEQEMGKRLEAILGTVEGVGAVSVTVSLENGPQKVFAENANTNERKIEENDSNGGHRVTTETTENDQMVLAQPASTSGQQPVVVKEIRPEIAGVLVVAQGAENAEVKVSLTRAVQTLLDLPAHRISILPKHMDD